MAQAKPDARARECPYCGEFDTILVDSKLWTFMACRKCGGSGPNSGSPEMALEKWNHRPPPKAREIAGRKA